MRGEEAIEQIKFKKKIPSLILRLFKILPHKKIIKNPGKKSHRESKYSQLTPLRTLRKAPCNTNVCGSFSKSVKISSKPLFAINNETENQRNSRMKFSLKTTLTIPFN